MPAIFSEGNTSIVAAVAFHCLPLGTCIETSYILSEKKQNFGFGFIMWIAPPTKT